MRRCDMQNSAQLQPKGTGKMWFAIRWGIALILLLTPLAMMQLTSDWSWTVGDFLFAGILIGSPLLLFELAARTGRSRAYNLGWAVTLGSCFLLIWSTVVRDDGNGIGFFLIVLAVGVGAFAGKCAADSLFRTLLGVSLMQALFGAAVATAPVVTQIAGASRYYALYTLLFCALWILSAACFRKAARN